MPTLKSTVAITVAVIAGILAFNYLTAPSCKTIGTLEASGIKLQCLVNLMQTPDTQVRERVCKELYNLPECELNEEDLPVVTEVIDKIINECIAKEFKDKNYCAKVSDEL